MIREKEIKNNLEDEFYVKLTCIKAWYGRKDVFDQIHGSRDESFELVYNFKTELEKKYSNSIIEIDYRRVGDKIFFNKVFMTLKPCIDGFLHGCRSYLRIDLTYLTGKLKVHSFIDCLLN
jgi:hypothetical protein